jgi:hypothetical protein
MSFFNWRKLNFFDVTKVSLLFFNTQELIFIVFFNASWNKSETAIKMISDCNFGYFIQ